MQLLIFILLAYLLGSIPFGPLVAKIWNIDIRRYGSGNIGATNVFRTLGTIPGLIVFLLDFLKGTLAVQIGYFAGGDPTLALTLGMAAILGHMYSVFLGFKGGKGAATGLGVLLGLTPDIFVISFLFACVVIALTRYVSLATLSTVILIVILMGVLHKPKPYFWTAVIVGFFIFLRHLPNIQRLLQGKENKI